VALEELRHEPIGADRTKGCTDDPVEVATLPGVPVGQ
jgi:hypothetical protein